MNIKTLLELLKPYADSGADLLVNFYNSEDQARRDTSVVSLELTFDSDGILCAVTIAVENS